MERNVALVHPKNVLDVDGHCLAHILHHLTELVHTVEVLVSAMQLLVELPLDLSPDGLYRVERTAVWRHQFRLEVFFPKRPYFL